MQVEREITTQFYFLNFKGETNKRFMVKVFFFTKPTSKRFEFPKNPPYGAFKILFITRLSVMRGNRGLSNGPAHSYVKSFTEELHTIPCGHHFS